MTTENENTTDEAGHAPEVAAGAAGSVLLEAALQYAIDRDQCIREHLDSIRREGDARRHGRNHYRTAAVVLARKVQAWDDELTRRAERINTLKDTIAALSSPNDQALPRRGEQTPMKKTNSRPASLAGAPGSALRLERAAIRAINAQKVGHKIWISCWTPSVGSWASTHADNISDAVKFLRAHAKNHANFEMRFESEPPRGERKA